LAPDIPPQSPSIALVRQRYSPFGGAERIISATLQELARQGASVYVVTRRWEHDAAFQPLIVNPFYVGRLWRDWSFGRAVARLLAGRRFDLVQANEKIPGCDVYRAGDGVHHEWLRQRARVANAFGRIWLRFDLYHRFVLARERAVLAHPRLNKVICISRMVRDDVLRNYPVPEAKLEVIHNGVDVARFRPERDVHRQAVRASLGIPMQAPVFLFVGSGYERKGVPSLLAAFSRLPDTAHLIIVGKDKALPQFRRRAARLGCGGRVHFAGGVADPRPHYASADAFVLPSLYEPFGSVVLEAMACGLPVIASTTCGAAELIRPGREGYVCDALDIDALRAHMTTLLDTTLAARMGRAARAVAETMTLERMADQMMQLYRGLMRAPREA